MEETNSAMTLNFIPNHRKWENFNDCGILCNKYGHSLRRLKFLSVLFSNACIARCSERQEGETSVEIKHLKNELVSLTGQQLIRRIRLFRKVTWALSFWSSARSTKRLIAVLVALWTFYTVLWRGAGWRKALAAPSSSAKVALRTKRTFVQQCQGGTANLFNDLLFSIRSD